MSKGENERFYNYSNDQIIETNKNKNTAQNTKKNSKKNINDKNVYLIFH